MSPRTAAANEKIRQASRAKILDAALRLFAEYGYERTSIRMIAGAADISQGLLYNYFESKDDLLRAIFQQSVALVRESFAAADGPGTPAERLERLIRASFAILRRTLPFWQLSYAVRLQPAVLAGLGPELPEWLAAIGAVLEEHLEAIGTNNPAVEANLLFAQIDGIAQHYAMNPDTYPLDAVVDALVKRYCRPQLANGVAP